MVKHIILWTLKSDISDSEKLKIKQHIKMTLEGLKGKIPGLIEIKVNIEPLEGSVRLHIRFGEEMKKIDQKWLVRTRYQKRCK